jgi:hypothetical protein
MSSSKQYEDALAKFLKGGGKVEVCPPRRAAGLSVGKLRSRFRHEDKPEANSTQRVKRKAWKGARAQLRD